MEHKMLLSPLEQLRIALGEQPQIRVEIPQNHTLQDISSAVSSVMNYILTDAFDLTSEESFWVGYELKTILSPISALRPRMYLAAVKKELDSKEYSEKLFSRDWDAAGQSQVTDPSVRQAPISDWVEMLSEVVLVSYPDLRSSLQAAVVGSIYGILTELGLSDDENTTRKSLYLPTAIRHIVGLQD
jgi:hypothetical protein